MLRENRWTKEFQFTLPQGERPMASVKNGSVVMFQFTLPQGERRARA